MSDVKELDDMFEAAPAATKPKKKRSKTKVWVTIFAIITIAVGGYWAYTQTIGKQDLVRQVESSGFGSVSYFAGNGEVSASATAKYGECIVRFVSTTQTVSDNSRVARLALVRDNGEFIYEPTPAKLAANDAFDICSGK